MAKGTALFDAVAISDTETFNVRYWQFGAASRGRCALGQGFTDAVPGNGGVVRMDDGAVTFKGGTISNTKAVRVCALRSLVARRKCSFFGAARCPRCCMPRIVGMAL